MARFPLLFPQWHASSLVLLVSAALACAPLETPTDISQAPAEAPVGEPSTAALSGGLRAAWIRLTQETASSVHDWSADREVRAGAVRWRIDETGLDSASDDDSWALRLSTLRLGREDLLARLPQPEVSVHRNEARLYRPGLIERWVSGPLGLEHLFELPQRPEGDGLLTIELEAHGLTPRLDSGGVALSDVSGVRVRYAELWVQDVEGTPVPAQLEVMGSVIRIGIDDRNARYPLSVDPLLVATVGTLQPAWRSPRPFDDGSIGDRVGASVAFHGDTALLGAPSAYRPASGYVGGSGTAYFFQRSGELWTMVYETGTMGGDQSTGWSVALESDTAIVGAPGLRGQEAFVFVREGPTWTHQATLSTGSTNPANKEGWSVALSGDTAIVGAPGYAIYPSNTRYGAAFVFARSDGTWTLQARLEASDRVAGDGFGWSVAIDRDTALVGAPQVDTAAGSNVGSAYIFTRSGTTWTQTHKLEALDGAANDGFGESVALRTGRALVGAPWVDGSAGSDTGAVYPFTRNGEVWIPEPRLEATDAIAGARFGESVALDGDIAAIGSVKADTLGVPGYNASGGGYLFQRGATGWVEQTRVAIDANRGYRSGAGASVAVHGGTAVFGAPKLRATYPYSGEVGGAFVFSVSRSIGSTCLSGTECSSGFCADGVCCDSACGASTDDCQACAIAAGAEFDGVCGPSSGNMCADGAACTTMSVCSAGSCGCGACPEGTFSADGTGATACEAWTSCAAGTRVASEGSATRDRACSPCPSGSYSDAVNTPECTMWRTCDVSEFESRSPSATTDRSCTALTDCALGDYVSRASTATSDRECAPCSLGSFSSSTNAVECSAWGDCPPGAFVSLAGTEVRDRACSPCPSGSYSDAVNAPECTTWRTCDVSEFESRSPSATTDRACTALTDCAMGDYVSRASTATSDRECAPCSLGSFSSSTNAAECSTWIDCSPGAFVSLAGSEVRDRACTSCPEGTYSSHANTLTCTPWTSCAPTEYESTSGSTFRDRSCSVVTVCGPEAFEVTPPTSFSDRVCEARTECPPGTQVSSPGGATTDRTCETCADGRFSATPNASACVAWTPCTVEQYEVGAPSTTQDRECRALTLCGPGEFEFLAPLPARDRICSACSICGPEEIEVAPCAANRDTLCMPAEDAGVREDGGGFSRPDAGESPGPTDAGGSDAAVEPNLPEALPPSFGCTATETASGPPTSALAFVALITLLGLRRRPSSSSI